jgi:hypothetical protein
MELSHRPGSPSREQRRGLRGGHRCEVEKLDLVAEGPSHFFYFHGHPHRRLRQVTGSGHLLNRRLRVYY